MGAWIETLYLIPAIRMRLSRTLMGAWIETSLISSLIFAPDVAPSWVRGLKQGRLRAISKSSGSHPHGCVD